MPRKRKIPPEFLQFKEEVEKLGLTVLIQRLDYSKKWCATVINKTICIWHTDGFTQDFPLTAFWESKAYKTYMNLHDKVKN